MPEFGFEQEEMEVWVEGSWTSQLCDLTLANINGNVRWNRLRWKEENTGDESQAYVRVDILDTSDNVLQSDLEGINQSGFKIINLDYTNVMSSDIKIRFKLYSLSASPIVYNVQLR